LTVWQIFAGGLVQCSNAIVAGGSMVVKINFPKETLVVAALGQTLVDFVVRLLLVVAALVLYRIMPPWQAVFFPLAILPMLLFTLGLGLFLSLANAIFRDIASIVTLLATFLMFVTPVLYPANSGLFAKVSAYNPLAVMVTAPRDLIFFGTISNAWQFAWSSALAIAIFAVSWRVFHLAEMRMAERIGSR
jgi:lipopolysaccharide transport system permease protein